MRIIAAALVGLFFLIGAAEAQTQAGKHRAYAKRNGQSDGNGGSGSGHAGSRRGNGYVQHDAEKLPFGSSNWWEQMRREGRLGGETP
jgi:hypothetical protein